MHLYLCLIWDMDTGGLWCMGTVSKFKLILVVTMRSVAHPGGCACISICAIMSYGQWVGNGDQQQMQYYLPGHQEA